MVTGPEGGLRGCQCQAEAVISEERFEQGDGWQGIA